VWEPSLTPLSDFDQLPAPLAVVVPFDVAPSNTSTVLLASAVPDTVTPPVLL
jgi:hypothetical protein